MNDTLPKKVTDVMLQNDAFSKWLGIDRVFDGTGSSVIKMVVRKEMLNGFSIAHGGIAYSIADTTLAFAANSNGYQSFSIETSISHLHKVQESDVLKASKRNI